VVVEAAAGSGALITASTALDQGREVMALPGNITSVVSIGTNRLIRDGAAPVLEAADVLQHFPECATARAADSSLSPSTRDLPQTLSDEERQLAGLVGPDPVHPDELANRINRPVNEVLGLLCVLEIAGVVVQRPGRVFRRV
jgi:DNA processing protein